jgi:hypothetical protein
VRRETAHRPQNSPLPRFSPEYGSSGCMGLSAGHSRHTVDHKRHARGTLHARGSRGGPRPRAEGGLLRQVRDARSRAMSGETNVNVKREDIDAVCKAYAQREQEETGTRKRAAGAARMYSPARN